MCLTIYNDTPVAQGILYVRVEKERVGNDRVGNDRVEYERVGNERVSYVEYGPT